MLRTLPLALRARGFWSWSLRFSLLLRAASSTALLPLALDLPAAAAASAGGSGAAVLAVASAPVACWQGEPFSKCGAYVDKACVWAVLLLQANLASHVQANLAAYRCCWRLLRPQRLLCPLLMAVLLKPAHVR